MYWCGFGISLLWSSQTGAGLRYGGLGTGGIVDVAGTIGPVFVFQSTLMASVFVKNTETNNRNELRNWKTKIKEKEINIWCNLILLKQICN